MNKFDSLIVADYDGTIKQKDNKIEMLESLKLMRILIERKIGFTISTGRLFTSMKEEIINLSIPFNYLSCANGNILFDEFFNLLWRTQVNPSFFQQLKPFYKNILCIDSLDEYGMNTSNNIVEYVIHITEDNQMRRKIVEWLLFSNEFDYCTDGENKYKIHIFNLSNKIKTIELLQQKLNISSDYIYTIGDGPNDLDMIKKYNGFVLGDDLGFDSSFALGEYDSFYEFAKDVQHGLVKRKM